LARLEQPLAVEGLQAARSAPAVGEAKLVRSNQWHRPADSLVELLTRPGALVKTANKLTLTMIGKS
jgi:hypothetical protein